MRWGAARGTGEAGAGGAPARLSSFCATFSIWNPLRPLRATRDVGLTGRADSCPPCTRQAPPRRPALSLSRAAARALFGGAQRRDAGGAVRLAAADGELPRRLPEGGLFRARVGAGRQQQANDRGVAAVARLVQRGPAAVVARAHVDEAMAVLFEVAAEMTA